MKFQLKLFCLKTTVNQKRLVEFLQSRHSKIHYETAMYKCIEQISKNCPIILKFWNQDKFKLPFHSKSF